ncbi:MAG: gamma-glutamyl-gamma-aminobutyrate hydrolase family protein [Chitinispirillales bacterium]|jgi:putative glutamine amidotransferase|nr:gamma-glutamyl-gamma-aminobutyrate hydrolase family protein [Chitinispirillales bacterium]
MDKPLIGIVPLWDEEKSSLWMLPGYMDGVLLAGGAPVMLPLTTDKPTLEQMCRAVDGILFTGGQDVSPIVYGEEMRECCGEVCARRDEMESTLFSVAVTRLDKPAFGICRGIQFLSAFLGGALYQDLGTEQKGGGAKLSHQQKPPYGQPSHRVKINPGTPLHALFCADEIAVNSCHHQGVKYLPPELVCMAEAEDGLAEAAYMPSRKFVWAVQWHPEHSLDDEFSKKLFLSFVTACSQPRGG